MNMRESFEAWIQSRYPEYPLDVELGNCGRPDSYTWTVVHQMWQAWQASRQQPIALPLINTEVKGEISEQDAGIVIRAMAVVKQLCKESITAQGYAVKESE